MCATRKAILTDARNRFLGNGYAQGMGQILDARNLHPGAGNPSNPLSIVNVSDDLWGNWAHDCVEF